MKKMMRNRILSAILALAMTASLLPAGLITPASAAVVITGVHDVGNGLQGSKGSFSITMKGGSGGLGSNVFLIIPDVSNQGKDTVPSAMMGTGITGDYAAPSGMKSDLAGIGAVLPENYYWKQGTGGESYDANGAIKFTANAMACDFNAALADLMNGGYVKADGSTFDGTETSIPMVAILWSGVSRAISWAHVVWDSSELTLKKEKDITTKMTGNNAVATPIDVSIAVTATGGSGTLLSVTPTLKDSSGNTVSTSDYSVTFSDSSGTAVSNNGALTSDPGTYTLKLYSNSFNIKGTEGPYTGTIRITYRTAAGTTKAEDIAVTILVREGLVDAASFTPIKLTVLRGTSTIASASGGVPSFLWSWGDNDELGIALFYNPHMYTTNSLAKSGTFGDPGDGSTYVALKNFQEILLAAADAGYEGGLGDPCPTNWEAVGTPANRANPYGAGIANGPATAGANITLPTDINKWSIGTYTDTISLEYFATYNPVDEENGDFAPASYPGIIGDVKPASIPITIEIVEADSVAFRGNGGTWADGSSGKTAVIGSDGKVISPGAPTRSGYNFTGWKRNGSGATIADSAIASQTGHTNGEYYTAQWEAQVVTHTVSFNSHGGSAVSDKTGVVSGSTITAPTPPTRTGHTFAGWYKEAAYTNAWNFSTDTVTSNITLHAKWTENAVTVNLKKDGANYASSGKTVWLTKDGTTFVPAAGVAANTTTGAAAMGNYDAGTYSIYVGTNASDRVDTNVDVTVSNGAASAVVNYYTVTTVAGSNAASAYVGAAANPTSGTSAVFLSGATAYLKATPTTNYTGDSATWSFTKPAGGDGTTPSAPTGKTNTHSFAVTGTVQATAAYSTEATYTAKIHLLENGVSGTYVTSGVTAVSLATAADGTTGAVALSKDSSNNGIWQKAVNASKTYSHAKITVDGAAYVVPLTTAIKYTTNEEEDVALYVITLKVDTTVSGSAAPYGSATVTAGGKDFTASSTTAAPNGTVTFHAPNITDAVTLKSTTPDTNYVNKTGKNWTVVSTDQNTGYKFAPSAATTVTAKFTPYGVLAFSPNPVTASVKDGYTNKTIVAESADGASDGYLENVGPGAIPDISSVLAKASDSPDNWTPSNYLTITGIPTSLGKDVDPNGASSGDWAGVKIDLKNGLAVGTYKATLTISSTDANVADLVVPITITVKEGSVAEAKGDNFKWDTYTQAVTQNQSPNGTTATWKTNLTLEDIVSVDSLVYGGTTLIKDTDYTLGAKAGTGENAYIPVTLTNAGIKKLAGLIKPSTSGVIVVSAKDNTGAVKQANITMNLEDTMPALASASFNNVDANNKWALGATAPSLTVTDNISGSTGLTGSVTYEWSVNGAVKSGWANKTNLTATELGTLSVGDTVTVRVTGTGKAWEAKPSSGNLYKETVSKTASFQVKAPDVTVNIKLDSNAYTAPGSGDKITASNTPLGSGVLLETNTTNAKKYVFVNWTLDTTGGGIFGTSGSNTTSTAATSIFTPAKAATVVANWKSIATVEYTKGATAVGPNSKSSGATVNDQYTETLVNNGAKTSTISSIALGGTDGSKFDITTTGVASATLAAGDTSSAFVIKPKSTTGAGTYTLTITTTYTEGATGTSTVVQTLVYTVPEPSYDITLVTTTGGTNRGNYKGANTDATTTDNNKVVAVTRNDSIALTGTADTGYKFVNWTLGTTAGSTSDKLGNAATNYSNAYGGVTKDQTITANFKAVTDLSESNTVTSASANVGYTSATNVYTGTVSNNGAKAATATYTLSDIKKDGVAASSADQGKFSVTPSTASSADTIGARTTSATTKNVTVAAAAGLGVGTYTMKLTIQETTAAADTMNGQFKKEIFLTFTVGGGSANIQVKLNSTFKDAETVTLLHSTNGSTISTTPNTTTHNYAATGLATGVAYKVLVNGVDTGVTVTATNTTTAGTATVQLWTLTTAVDPSNKSKGDVNVSGGTLVTVTGGSGYVSGGNVTLAAAPTSGNRFKEWTDERTTKNLGWTNNKNTTNPVTIAMTADRSVKAWFEEIPAATQYVTVTYHDNKNSAPISDTTNGDAVLATATHEKSTAYTVANLKPTISGYTFVKWNTKADGTGTNYVGGNTVTAANMANNLDLYAVWVKEPVWPVIVNGVYGDAYSWNATPSGYTATIENVPAASLGSGNYNGLPTGLTLQTTGTDKGKITGKPAETGTYQFVLKLTDGTSTWTREYTLFIDKATPSLSGISFSNAANGVKTNALEINGTAKAPLYKPAVWTDPKSYTYTKFVNASTPGTSTQDAKDVGSLKVTEYEGSATTASTEIQFGSDTSKTGKVTFTPSTSTATGATVTHQTSQKYSDIYKSVTVPCTFNLGGKTYDITVDPDRIPTAAGGAYPATSVDIEVGGTLPTTTAWQFDVSNKGNQPAHVTYTLEGTNASSFVLTPSYSHKFQATDAANNNDAIDANTTGAAAGVSPNGKEFTVGVASGVSNTTPGVYVAQVRVENYAVNADGSKGALQDTVIVPLRFEVKAATFDASVQIDLYNVTGTGPLTKQKEPRDASVVLKYDSGNASNDVTATWKSDTTGDATGNAPGVYTATLNKGTTYHVVVNGYDTGVAISKDATSGTVKLYQVVLDVSGNSDVTTAVKSDIKALQVGPGYLAAGESGTVTTPNVYTDNATPKNNFDFATATKWQILYKGDASATAGSATANYSSFTMPTGSNAKAVTLTAPYTKRASDQVKISYHSNYGTDIVLWEQTVTKGTTPTLSKGEPSRSGYTFVKWNTQANGGGTDYAPNATLGAALNADMDLYAVWEAVSDLALAPATITGTYKHAITNVSPTVTGGSGSVTGYTSASDAFPLYTLAMNATTGVVSGTPNDVGTKKSTVTVTDSKGDTASAVYTVVIGKADVVPDTAKPLPTSVTVANGSTSAQVTTAITTALGNTQMNGDGTGETKINGTWSVSGTVPTTPGTHSVTVVFTPANKTGETSPRDKDGDHYKTYTTTIPVVIGGKLITDADLDTGKTMVPKTSNNLVMTVPTTDRTLDPNGNTGDPTYTNGATKGDVVVSDVKWTKNGTALTATEKAAGGNDYALYITLTIEEGSTWRFDPNGFNGSTIAGRPATAVAVNDTMAVLRVNFPKQITVIDVATNTPIHNATSNQVWVPVSHENEYEITSYKWYESKATPATSGEVGSGTPGSEVKFDENSYYDLVVTVKPKTGMDFSDAIKGLKAGNTMNNCNGTVEDADIARVNNKEPDKEAPLASNKKFVTAEADYNATDNTITIRYRAFQPANQTLIGLRVEGTPGVYYAQTGDSKNHYDTMNTGAATPDNTGNTGSKDTVTFNFNYNNLTVYPLYQSADKATITEGTPLAAGDYTVTVDGGKNIPADGFKDQYTYNSVARTDVADFDNKTLVVTVGTVKSSVAGILRVQQLRADVMYVTGTVNPTLRYEPGDTFAFDSTASGAIKADVSFNTDVAGLDNNTVSNLTYAAYGDATKGLKSNPNSKTYFFEYGENLPTFEPHKSGDPSSLAAGLVDAGGKWINELVPGATGTTMTAAMGGKTLYATYVDVNHNVVRVPLGKINMDSEFTTDITDPNGGDPEYGDVLVGTPKQPDGTPDPNPNNYTYEWQKWVPGTDGKDPTDPTATGTWEPITTPDGKDRTHVPGKNEVDKYIRVVATDGDTGTSQPSDPVKVEPRSINFDVAPVNKAYDGDEFNDDHKYTSGDFRPTEVKKVYDGSKFVAAAQVFGGPIAGDTIVISPYVNGSNGWNDKVTNDHYANRPQYRDATYPTANGVKSDVGSLIVWPVVLVDTAAADYAIGHTSGYSLAGTDDNGAGKPVYRLASQDQLYPRGVIMNGGGSVMHVNVDFQNYPTVLSAIPNYPDAEDAGADGTGAVAVTDKRETRPGEVLDHADDNTHTAPGEGYPGNEYIAKWYPAAANFDPTNPGTAITASTFDGSAVTVMVKVTPRKGYQYELLEADNSNIKTATKFHFHFGKDVTVDLPVANTGEAGVRKVTETKDGKNYDVYYMWYTFSDLTTPPFVSDALDLGLTAADFVYYANTDAATPATGDHHWSVNDKADNENNTPANSIPGGKANVTFTYKLQTVINAIDNGGAGTALGRTDGSTVTLNAANYGSTWRLKAGKWAGKADKELAATANSTTGRTFKDTVKLLGSAGGTANTGDSQVYDGLYVYIEVTVGAQNLVYGAPLGVGNGATPEPLTVKELEAQSITAVGNLKLDYTAGNTFDASGITKATIGFNSATTAMNVSYDAVKRANAQDIDYTDATNDEGKVYFFQKWDAANGFVALTHGTSLGKNDNGKIVYICYTDVNNHIVRQPLGALQIKDAPVAGKISKITITYPEPVKDKTPTSKRNSTLWTYDMLTNEDEVSVAENALVSGEPRTDGTTWYTTTLTSAPADSAAIKAQAVDTKKLGATDTFVAGTYYMVQGVITSDGLAFDTTNGVTVNINGIEVAVGDPATTAMGTRNDGTTAVAWAMAEFNDDESAIIVRYVAKTLDKNLVTAVAISYTTPVAPNKAAEYVNYVDRKMVTVTKYADDTTNGTKWYPVGSASDFSTSGTMMTIGTTQYADGGYYLVENVIKPNKDYMLSASTEVYVDGVLKVVADGSVATTSNTDGLRSAKAVFNADGTITVQSIYKVPDFVPGKVNSVTITYPEPVANKDPVPSGKTLWTYQYLSENVSVDEAADRPADFDTTNVDPIAKDTVGSTWYITGLTSDPTQFSDFDPTGLNELPDAGFDFGKYYMVEGTITANSGYTFGDTVYVTINGVLVKVDEQTVKAKYDAEGIAIGWAVAVKDGNAIKARYIAKTVEAETKVIYEVEGKVKQPSPNDTISNTVGSKRARFEKTNADATNYVTYGNITWSKSDSFGSGYIPVTSTETTFQAGKYYQAEFTVEANTGDGYTFQVVDVDTGDPDFVAFLINDVTKLDGTWINDKSLNETATADNITVSAEQATNDDGSDNTNKYKITVQFPLTGEPKDLTVVGKTGTPAAGKTAGATDISVDSGEPYEIEAKKWQHYTDTGWTDMADSDTFVAGDYYRAVMDVKLKDGQENLYKFTNTTPGQVNKTPADPANDLPNDQPTRNSYRTNIIRKTTGDKVTPIILAQEFRVDRKLVDVQVEAPEPKSGVYSNDSDIKIYKVTVNGDRYELEEADGLEGRWYTADGVPMNGAAFEAGKTYYLKTVATAKNGYALYGNGEISHYQWFVGDNKLKDAKFATSKQQTADGDTLSSEVTFEYSLAAPNYVNVIPANANAPEYSKPLGNGWTDQNFKVKDTVWYEGEKKIGDIDASDPVDYTYAKESTVYTAAITVELKDGVHLDPDEGKLIYTFNGEICKTDEYRKNPDGTYTLLHTFPQTGKAPEPSAGGGGVVAEESPVVYYLLKDQGVTDDPTAEKVRKNSTPKKVPTVKAMAGLVFKGWSEVDPSTLPAGTLPTLVDPTTFKITQDKWFYAVYERGVDHKHYVIGFPNGTFGPDAKITRAEVATIIARSCLEGFVEGANYGNPGNYNDVSHHWAFSAIAFCAREGVFNGYEDGTFRPDRYITRQELATVVARLAGIQTSQGVPFNDKNQIASWAMNGIYTAYANGWIRGYEDGTFQPERDVNRAETVKIFNGYLKRGVDAKGLEGLKEYIHSGVASNNKEDGNNEYMTWPDVPKTHWAYLEIIEAANDHDYHWQDDVKKLPPEDWDKVYIDEKWRYNDNADDGAEKRDENMNAQKTFTVTYLVSSNGVTYDAITETVDRFSSPKPENMPIAVPNEGYRFVGWSATDPSTGEITLVDPTASGVTADKWFYAVFEEDKPAVLPIYTVTYVIGKNGSYDGATVERVEMFQAPSTEFYFIPTAKKGYRFIGWSETDPAAGGYAIVDPTANYITGDKTFYAVYEKI